MSGAERRDLMNGIDPCGRMRRNEWKEGEDESSLCVSYFKILLSDVCMNLIASDLKGTLFTAS
jgi:hypothetical protein